MSFHAFLSGIFREGDAILRGLPGRGDDAAARKLLEERHAEHTLDVAGPPIAFDPEAARRAGEVLWWASWCLVRRDEPLGPLEDAEKALASLPQTAAAHLSVDLTLRFLPQVARRARSLEPGGRLEAVLVRALRRWPLSGALGEDASDPTGDVTFEGHEGLILLHEERLARRKVAA